LILPVQFVNLEGLLMKIVYWGKSSFLIRTKEARIVTDPFRQGEAGSKHPSPEADIVTLSSSANHNVANLIKGEPLIIDLPGRFEKQAVKISGYSEPFETKESSEERENILFRLISEEISLLHTGYLRTIPKDNLLDRIGNIDILMIPLGEADTLKPQEAVKLVKKIEPAIILPMLYGHQKTNQEQSSQNPLLEEFIREMDLNGNLSRQDELVIKKADLPEDRTEVIVLGVNS